MHLLEKVKGIVCFHGQLVLCVLGCLRDRLEPPEFPGELAAVPGAKSCGKEPPEAHGLNQK